MLWIQRRNARTFVKYNFYPVNLKLDWGNYLNRKISVFALLFLLAFVVLDVKAQGQFVGSKNSDIYHYPSCNSAQQISSENKIWFADGQDAVNQGYRPCKNHFPPLPDGINVLVNSVVDGDTFDFLISAHPEEYTIRLADIDAPEQSDNGYLEATEYLKSLVEDKQVVLDIDNISITDPYDRYVSLVFVEFNSTHYMNVNQALVIGGYAEVDDFTNNEFDPSTWNLYELISSEEIPEFPNLAPIIIVLTVTILIALYKRKINHRLASTTRF